MNLISYDENFILSTLPSTPRGKGLVQPGRVLYLIMYGTGMRNSKVRKLKKKKVDLKYDPFNVGILYAYVNKKWVKCISEYYYLLEEKHINNYK